MEADFAKLNALVSKRPDLASALLAAGPSVVAINNSSVIDRSFNQLGNALADRFAQYKLYANELPFASSPIKPNSSLNAVLPPELNIAAGDIVIPIRYIQSQASNQRKFVAIDGYKIVVRFQNFTVLGDAQCDLYFLNFNGANIPTLQHSVINTASGAANSATEWYVPCVRRSTEGVMNNTDNVLTLNAPQSSGWGIVMEHGLITGNITPAAISEVVDYGTVAGASLSTWAGVYTTVIVLRQLGAVSTDIAVTPYYVNSATTKNNMDLYMAPLEASLRTSAN